jgi:hypothetical protein
MQSVHLQEIVSDMLTHMSSISKKYKLWIGGLLLN